MAERLDLSEPEIGKIWTQYPILVSETTKTNTGNRARRYKPRKPGHKKPQKCIYRENHCAPNWPMKDGLGWPRKGRPGWPRRRETMNAERWRTLIPVGATDTTKTNIANRRRMHEEEKPGHNKPPTNVYTGKTNLHTRLTRVPRTDRLESGNTSFDSKD